MRSITAQARVGLALFLVLAGTATVLASGATFALTGQGLKLGKGTEAEEGGKEVMRFEAKAAVGTPFTLTAQGMVLPRGGAAEPGEPESGKWTFDAKQFKQLADEGKAEKTKISVRLQPTSPGVSRVRFVGVILGYERTIEVVLDVTKED